MSASPMFRPRYACNATSRRIQGRKGRRVVRRLINNRDRRWPSMFGTQPVGRFCAVQRKDDRRLHARGRSDRDPGARCVSAVGASGLAEAVELLATNAWLDLRADWTKLAEASDKEDRPHGCNKGGHLKFGSHSACRSKPAGDLHSTDRNDGDRLDLVLQCVSPDAGGCLIPSRAAQRPKGWGRFFWRLGCPDRVLLRILRWHL
jgi:hypothetical protein